MFPAVARDFYSRYLIDIPLTTYLDRESPPPRSDESKPSRSRRSKKEKTGGDPNLPTGVKTASKEQKQSITVSHSLRPGRYGLSPQMVGGFSLLASVFLSTTELINKYLIIFK